MGEIIKQNNNSNIVVGSRNVLIEPSIHNAGDIILGDTITEKDIPYQAGADLVFSEFIIQFNNFLAEDNIKEAINSLVDFSENKYPKIHNEGLHISGSWELYLRKQQLGTYSTNDLNSERIDIFYKLLSLANRLQQ
jgi:hypothetical protein